MGWWARIKKGAVAAVFLAGSAIGIVAKFASILKRLKKAKKAKKAKEAAEASRNAARKVAKGGCFTAGMRVALACGCFIPIQDIQVGDRVLAEIPAAVATDTPERGAFLITGTSMRIFDGAIQEITVEDAAGQRDIIRGTPEHPVWSPETRHWVALADLRTGQRLQGAKGPIRVVSRQIRFARLPVFNLGVGGAHSYRIGKLSILVHNNPCDAAKGGLDPDIAKKIKKFSKKSLQGQKKEFSSLKKTYEKHLKKYGQKPGKTTGETNRMERELERMKEVLKGRGQSVD